MTKAKLDGSEVVGTMCGTALVLAEEIHRRVLVNGEIPKRVARSLGLTHRQITSVVRILSTFGGVPSPERLALIVMQAPDLSDEDIARWFNRPTGWATNVRKYGAEIAKTEFIPADVAWVADEWEPDDPTPEEIRERCKAIREQVERPFPEPEAWTAPQFHWHGGHIGSFLPIRP
jgi:hypothetical protein